MADPFASDTDAPINGTKYRVNPILADRVNRLIAEAPPELQADLQHAISSGYRSYEQQMKAYANFMAGGGLAAQPGHSWHQRDHGLAVDWNNVTPHTWQYLKTHAIDYGLGFPLGSRDPYHMQPIETYQGTTHGLREEGKPQHPIPLPDVKVSAPASTPSPPLPITPINPLPLSAANTGAPQPIVTKPAELTPPPRPYMMRPITVPSAPSLSSTFMGGLRRILAGR